MKAQENGALVVYSDYAVVAEGEPHALIVIKEGESNEAALVRAAEYAKGRPMAIKHLQVIYDEACAKAITAPIAITEEEWWYALEVLPPRDWQGTGSDAESFKMIEHDYGHITGIYMRHKKRYFMMKDSVRLSREDIFRKLFLSEAYRNIEL